MADRSSVIDLASPVQTPAELVAQHLGARRIGSGRWMAKCPAHDDASPSLAIASGRDGRVLLRCWAGCDLDSILKAAGLSIASLFPDGPRPTPAQLQAAAAERERQEADRLVQREREHALADRYRFLNRHLDGAAHELASLPDGAPEAHALTANFHGALQELRSIETLFIGDAN